MSGIIFNTNNGDQHPAETQNHDMDTSGNTTNSGLLTVQIANLIAKYQKKLQEKAELSTPLHVDEIASKVAKLYELLRKVIDWKEDNLLRRNATERILKRMLLTKAAGVLTTQQVDVSRVAESVIMELIRGGHLPNDEIPSEKITTVAKSLSKYVYLLEHAPINQQAALALKTQINFFTFIIELAACELEEILVNTYKEDGIIMSMTQLLYERIRITPANGLTDEEIRAQTFIAVCRTLYDLDDAYISYHLIKFRNTEWIKSSVEFTQSIAPQIISIWLALENELEHPHGKQFYALAERFDTVFTLLDDFLTDYRMKPEEILPTINDREKFKSLLHGYYDKRFQTLKKRLFRLAIFSTLSVFVSNWFTFFVVEVPLAHLFYEGFNFFTATIDFVVPTIAMFILVAIIRPPGKDNVTKVIDAVFSYIYTDTRKELYEIKVQRKSRPTFQLIVTFIYAVITVVSFYFVGWIFYKAGLPITSVIFDTVTIALNIFAAVMIRNKSKELNVDDKSSMFEFLLDMLSVPVARIGSVLANKWKEYNIVAIFFTFLIETPFVIILDFIEHWSNFLKERKAELH